MRTLAESILAGRKSAIADSKIEIILEAVNDILWNEHHFTASDVKVEGSEYYFDGGGKTPVLHVDVKGSKIIGILNQEYESGILDNVHFTDFHIKFTSIDGIVPGFVSNLTKCFVSIDSVSNVGSTFEDLAGKISKSKDNEILCYFNETNIGHRDTDRYNHDFGKTNKLFINSFVDVTNISGCTCKLLVLPTTYKIGFQEIPSDLPLANEKLIAELNRLVKDNHLTSLGEASHSAQYRRYFTRDGRGGFTDTYIKAWMKRFPKV